MAYSIAIPIDAGTAGLTLLATFQNTSGTVHATLRNLSCTEVADGFYRFSTALVDAGYRGYVYFHTGTYTSAFSDVEIYATTSINPQENEFPDSGPGAFVVTVTVTNASGGAALENALVRLAEGVNAYTALTNASGVATFALDAATYTRSITKPGFTHTSDTIIVSAAANFATTMAAVAIPAAPSNPAKATVYAYFMHADGQPARNVTVTAKLNLSPTLIGSVLVASEVKAKSNDAGLVTLELFKTNTAGIVPSTVKWHIVSEPASLDVTVAVTATLDLGTLVV